MLGIAASLSRSGRHAEAVGAYRKAQERAGGRGRSEQGGHAAGMSTARAAARRTLQSPTRSAKRARTRRRCGGMPGPGRSGRAPKSRARTSGLQGRCTQGPCTRPRTDAWPWRRQRRAGRATGRAALDGSARTSAQASRDRGCTNWPPNATRWRPTATPTWGPSAPRPACGPAKSWRGAEGAARPSGATRRRPAWRPTTMLPTLP